MPSSFMKVCLNVEYCQVNKKSNVKKKYTIKHATKCKQFSREYLQVFSSIGLRS